MLASSWGGDGAKTNYGKKCGVLVQHFAWEGIIEHQFNKRLESFGSWYSQSFLLADFKENHTVLFSGLKIRTQNFVKQENLRLFYSWIAFCRMENECRKRIKRKTKPWIKMPFKNSIYGLSSHLFKFPKVCTFLM